MATETDMCVDGQLIISEFLCYLTCKYSKTAAKMLKLVLNDFYSSDDISVAKELLIDSVDKICTDKWPRPPRRKQGDNKSRTEIEDIFGVLDYMDENLLISKLPTFVVKNVDNVPS